MKKAASIILTTLISMVMISCSHSQKDPVAKAMEEIDALFTKRYAPTGSNDIIPGGAVLIMKGDSILFDKGYGYADLKRKYKISGNTFFNIASCSKQFSAVAILKLQEMQLIDIDKSIYDVSPLVTPYLPSKRAPFTDITPVHLMSHSSGIMDQRPRDDRDFVLHATDMQSIEYMKDIDSLRFAPGTNYEYINPTFQLLYLFIEKLTGMSFEEFMSKNIFAPAKMLPTLYFSPDADIPDMAHGYIPTDSTKNEFIEYDYGEENFFGTKADGGIYTSTHLFANWIKALRDNKVISAASKARAWTPLTKVTGSPYSDYQNRANTYYGLGWFIDQQPGFPQKIYHTGDNGGFQIYEGYYPEADLTVLVFENRNDHSRWKMVEQIDQILLQAGLTKTE